jgi:hypothetical protein
VFNWNQSISLLFFNDISKNANLLNIYGNKDGIQTRGYIDGSVIEGIITKEDISLKKLDGFINLEVNQPTYYYPIFGHTNLKSKNVWNNYVIQNLTK